MRVLLFDTFRQQYFQGPEAWTFDAASATDLESTVQAVNAALQNGVATFEIVLAFDQPVLANMHLPLNAARPSTLGARISPG